jgi:hypothetical protein
MSDPGQTDALAAEYVLGTLDSEERTQAQALLEIDQEFVAKVSAWERRLGELHLMVEPVEPDAKVWARVKARMPQPPPRVDAKLPAAPQIPEAPLPAPAPEETTPPPDTAAATPAEASVAEGASPAPVDTPAPSWSASPAPAAAASPAATPSPSPVPSPVPSPILPPSPSAVPSSAPSPTSPSVAAPPLKAAAPLAPPPIPAPRMPAVERDGNATLRVQRRLRRWRAFAALLVLVVMAAGGLIAAWKFVPDRVPPMLHPVELMRLVGVTIDARPVRKPAPPESQFDE